MISGRIYSMSFNGVTLTQTQDLLCLYAGATKIFAVLSVSIGQMTATSVANQRVRIRYLPPALTAGSGGSAGLLRPYVPGDVAATITGRVNDTTQATSSGSPVDLWDDQWNVVNGFLWTSPIPSRPIVCGLNGAIVVSLDSAPSALVASATIVCEELP